jgi:hypothetical protein
MGFRTEQERLKAIQRTLDEAGFEFRYFVGYGVVVAALDAALASIS